MTLYFTPTKAGQKPDNFRKESHNVGRSKGSRKRLFSEPPHPSPNVGKKADFFPTFAAFSKHMTLYFTPTN